VEQSEESKGEMTRERNQVRAIPNVNYVDPTLLLLLLMLLIVIKTDSFGLDISKEHPPFSVNIKGQLKEECGGKQSACLHNDIQLILRYFPI